MLDAFNLDDPVALDAMVKLHEERFAENPNYRREQAERIEAIRTKNRQAANGAVQTN
jgi:hypothetical protein